MRYALTFVGLLAALSERPISEGVWRELRLLGVYVGSVVGAGLLLLGGARCLRRSRLALRVGSTALLVAGLVALPALLSYVSLSQLILSAFAVGYATAAAIRVPFMLGLPRYGALPMRLYDYLCGGLLLGLCLALSAPQCCRALQTKSLLSAVFERRVTHHEIMRLMQTTE